MQRLIHGVIEVGLRIRSGVSRFFTGLPMRLGVSLSLHDIEHGDPQGTEGIPTVF